MGLSPRVRGNHPSPARSAASPGSIPACAGEPPARRCARRCGGVYPRVCGGTSRLLRRTRCASGLSPRVRGNRNDRRVTLGTLWSIPACAGEPGGIVRHAVGHGSIPACAGEPAARPRRPRRTKVYPRVCGGTQALLIFVVPATVYPRVCGGTVENIRPCVGTIGLSPRVRGNRAANRKRTPNGGSIPACAGEPRGARLTAHH